MNKVVLIGRLTKDPEVRYTQNQKVICQFTLAVDRPFRAQNGDQEADFIPVVLWGKPAELAGNSCMKGHRLCVEGRIRVHTYEDDSTHKTVWFTEVIGDHIEFIEKKSEISRMEVGSADKMDKIFSKLGTDVSFDEEVSLKNN